MSLKTTSQLFTLLVLSLLVFTCNNNDATSTIDKNTDSITVSEEITTTDQNIQKVTPPLENVDVPFQAFEVQPSSAQTLTLDNGSSIEIPASTFVDKSGQPVTEPVKVQYREFHDAAAIIASGIPMSVQMEDGTKEWMQTAGMFELKGYTANQEEVFIANDKAITVNMASSVDGDYDFWYFDPEQGNWESQATVGAQPNAQAVSLNTEIQELQQQAAKPPVKPVLFDRKKPSLNFELSYDDFPELKDKRGIVWQYAGKNKKEDPANNTWIFEQQWDDIDLKSEGEAGTYRLTLQKDTSRYSIPVYPSQKEQDYALAKAEYEKKLAAYQAVRETLRDRETMARQKKEFLRTYKVQNFGIYNYDILYKMPNRLPLAADFNFEGLENQDLLKPMVTVYLITGEERAIVAYDRNAWDRFSFDPQADNKLVALLPGNRIATFSQEEFKKQLPKIRQSNGNFQFNMDLKEAPVESVADIKDQILI